MIAFRKVFSVAQFLSVLTVGSHSSNIPATRTATHSTSGRRQWPALCLQVVALDCCLIAYWWESSDRSSKDFTQTLADLHCVALRETEARRVPCRFVVCQPKRCPSDTTALCSNTSAMICSTLSYNKPKSDAIRRNACPSVFLDACSVDLCRGGTSSSTSVDCRRIVPARC
jgi:hypothetical protein